ncbi:hypothetical protein EYF80_056465 [Liparis tanakae]|uniref:Uncharacterized protein n=1 Tax=Liparis tanakae TaxID=230148 RepID=A0A4Z2EX26_9TELE|nr:hypothetical protein EYF80_056465 [Liparis tanakae]
MSEGLETLQTKHRGHGYTLHAPEGTKDADDITDTPRCSGQVERSALRLREVIGHSSDTGQSSRCYVFRLLGVGTSPVLPPQSRWTTVSEVGAAHRAGSWRLERRVEGSGLRQTPRPRGLALEETAD